MITNKQQNKPLDLLAPGDKQLDLIAPSDKAREFFWKEAAERKQRHEELLK